MTFSGNSKPPDVNAYLWKRSGADLCNSLLKNLLFLITFITQLFEYAYNA